MKPETINRFLVIAAWTGEVVYTSVTFYCFLTIIRGDLC